ncbi:SGNH/GDSL hydrolase family protein [Schlesneria paludicola]|uniref:SGNH/GDSL hydrolase family protein n=1 Tax=Schlesneria paludicola TaxID=360056 RepID=UPI00029A3F76|nr:SGNH/GDSL hydrolase family protein [Schlesneria paludicola]
MLRAGLKFIRRFTFATSLLILLICGAEVGVRLYEAAGGTRIQNTSEASSLDPSRLTVPSSSCHQELMPLATARVACRDSKSEVVIHTNSLGLRGREPAIPKPSDVCRIVVLGDETIFAPETDDADHFCTLLQTQLQQHSTATIEVINAGVPGHCPLTEFVLFKQRLLNLKPDLVLMHFDWSDVSDDQQVRRQARCDESHIVQACPHPKLTARQKGRPIEQWRQQFRLLDWGLCSASSEWKSRVARQKASSRDADLNPYAWLRDERPERNVGFCHSIEPIVEIAKLCRSSFCQFALFTSPKPWQVSARCCRGAGIRLASGVARDACYANRAPFKALQRFADHQKILFFDGTATLTSGKSPEVNFLNYAPRWSHAGHQHMADDMTRFLLENAPDLWNRNYVPRSQNIHSPLTRIRTDDDSIQWTSGTQQQSRPPETELKRQTP